MITVVIVDDQPMVRQALRSELESQPDLQVVGEAEDGQAALAMVEALRPGVVVMDVKMTPMDGLEATERLRRTATECRIIVLSLYDDPEVRSRAEHAGAVAFVSKHEPIEGLLAAIRSAT